MEPILDIHFYATESGAEPVREWLKLLPAIDRKVIGEDMKTVQFGWPLGMPHVRSMGGGIWEVRIRLETGSPECCSCWRAPRWFCSTASSRRRKPHLNRTWTWPRTGSSSYAGGNHG